MHPPEQSERSGEDARPPGMVKADFLSGIVFLMLGVGVVVESLRMPTFQAVGANPYTVPGIVPALIGSVIALLGFILLVRAALAGGWRLGVERRLLRDPAVGRFVLALALTIGYAAGLVTRLPFWLATFVFVFLFVALFEWRADRVPSGHAVAIGVALVLAAVIAGVVTYVFQYIFLVRLP